MRTLVISDLHLGSHLRRDVLRRPAGLAALLGALDGVDRLVLLGDVVELLEGRPREAMDAAVDVLEEVGAAMGRGRRVVVALGNHDHALIRPWLREQRAAGRRIGLATRVPVRTSDGLGRIVDALKPAKVEVRYPGVWIGPRVWAHHGHYLDRHLLPSQGVGAGILGPVLPERGTSAEDYERAGGPSAAAIQGLLASALPPALGEGLDLVAGLARRASYAAIPLASGLLEGGGIAPLSSQALGTQFRRAGLPAMALVAERLRVRADHVLFGHLHRLGPRPGDLPSEWNPRGGPDLWNTGSWVHEPLLLTGAEPPHPYWPGGAVLVEDEEPPQVLGLLDDVPASDLRPEEPRPRGG